MNIVNPHQASILQPFKGQSVPTSLAKIHKSLQQQSGHFLVPNWQCQHSGLGFTLCFGLQRWPAVSWHLSSLRAVHQGFSWTLNVANNRKCHQNVTFRIIARKTPKRPKRVLGSVASCLTRDVQIPAACAFGAAFALVLTHHRIIIPSIPSIPSTTEWVCLKIVYPYTQWLMIITPTKWLFHWGYNHHPIHPIHHRNPSRFHPLLAVFAGVEAAGAFWLFRLGVSCVKQKGEINCSWQSTAK